ncbi:hypothetical protein PHLCEN_2v1953 [Hermanssonia centrifuga]|uniref:Uncharacterized protein n=1 Tax=Hermanssonia centrifuga TaxID=98765 RepID=A0A2R6RVJ3_9APHY|nr:hypothetical protein PHLCEN_2v1953 [Hermanssonia centrifuga]
MSKLDSAITLDIEDNEEVADIFSEFGLQPQSPKLAEALFGSARQRSLDKVKASSSRRDSPTLPWRNPSVRSTAREPKRADRPSDTTFPPRSNSPDIDAIIAKTPRPRRSSTSVLSTPSPASRSLTSLGVRNRSPQNIGAKKVARDETSLISDFGALLEADSDLEDDNGSETDSSLDIHTPLPHLMFRDGLLSPRSKLLPQSSSSPFSYPEDIINSIDPRAASVLSVVSTAGSAMTKSGLQKDPRDTQRRRIRHRDGRLLRAGMGLTTGLGWSDSEDEDAPSALTRRLISTTIERKRSDSLASPSRRTSQYDETSRFGSPVPPSKSSVRVIPFSSPGHSDPNFGPRNRSSNTEGESRFFRCYQHFIDGIGKVLHLISPFEV